MKNIFRLLLWVTVVTIPVISGYAQGKGNLSGALHTERGREEIIVENPTYVQQPLIQAVVDHLLGKSVCGCDGESATLTNWVMDKILNKL